MIDITLQKVAIGKVQIKQYMDNILKNIIYIGWSDNVKWAQDI